MAMSMSPEETFRFIELYQIENCLWNRKNRCHKNKNIINDSWKRIADTMGVPILELKRKKENLLSTFRVNLKKKMSSLKSGAGEEEVFQPIWPFYEAMEAFLADVYTSASQINSEENEQSENANTSQVLDNDPDEVSPTPKRNPNIQSQKRRALNPPELQEASKNMSTAFTALNSVLANKEKRKEKEEDECDLFCKMLAKQIREFPKFEREEIMYELHGFMLNKRRLYNKMIQGIPCTISSPSQLRSSSSNSPFELQAQSPSYLSDPVSQ
ncbi:uncharacterized protein LOC114334246 [Diabrotica virgifera virgifera]|uniref:MADF domain-containing protein n=1 Tax=Diabrotica virgifera virgifera TaxID=50390 RepID=A0ABM5IRX0_DIAVI|nr:uncharacterized protein LOC114334246 [Diabrotica virgifera virgifera]